MTYTELKIRLMQQGAKFSPAARQAMCRNKFGQISFMDYATTGGVVTVIDGRVYANVPVKFQDTPFLLDRRDDRFVLFYEGNALPNEVQIIPAPKYALDALRLDDGTPIRELVMTHADRVRISPIHGCSYHCSFCTCNTSSYREISCEQLDAAFRIALSDPYNQPRHALISGGTPKETEESFSWLNGIYYHFPTTYPNMDFDVMLSPRCRKPAPHTEEGYVDFLRYLHDECGVKTLSVNLELYNEEYRRRFIPEKAAVGIDNYLTFIRQAVAIFGLNTIRSSLIAGLEPMDDTLRGVQILAENGCLPVLSAFIPAPGTDGATYPAPTPVFLLELVAAADQIAHTAGLPLGPLCRPCTHNSITLE